MPSVKCPYCDNEFEWTKSMGESRVQCPLCNKTMAIVRKQKKAGTDLQPRAITAWGTDGFGSEKTRAEYGEIKKGDVLGGFRIEEMIGAGAMAVVYQATQLSLDRRVALKILPKEFAQKESFVRQFDSETDLLASLNHPNIVTIIDRGRADDTYFFAMEYVEGTTLGELLSAGELDEEFFLRIMEQSAEALEYAHSKDIIHRDIKPANIMLNDQGMVKVADFGVAGLLAEARAESGGKRRVMGTRGYMAPEQEIDVRRTDARSDIFSLGAVMYRALTDKVPDHLPPVPPSRLNPEIDPRLDKLVLKCLEITPDRRYQSAPELLEAIRSFQREFTHAWEVCPQCKKENPVTQKTCVHCGADLSELFDVCPECGAENRIDVEVCMGCGTSLSQLRQRTSVWISRTEEGARELAVRHEYEDAIKELQPVLGVKGKVFRRAREKAERLIRSYNAERAKYYKERVEEGKRLAGQGDLTKSLETLEPIPEEFALPAHLPDFIGKVTSRMEVARRMLSAVSQLLEERNCDEAQKLIDNIATVWVDCAGLAEARTQLAQARETEQMLDYELTEVQRHLESGQFAEARKALEFARSTMPDNPRVRQLEDAIERGEKVALVKKVFARGKAAFDKGDVVGAVGIWQEARELLPEGDQLRQSIQKSIDAAQQKLQAETRAKREAAARAQAEAEAAARKATKRLAIILTVIVAAILMVGAVILYFMFAY